MKAANSSTGIAIPKWLHELHGSYSSRRDLALVQGCAWGVTALVVGVAVLEGFDLWVVALLALLVVDIAGGVVSNVTPETNAHYNASRRARVVFLTLHVLQPALLIWLFPTWAAAIAVVAMLTLATAFGIEFFARRSAAAPSAVAAAIVLLTAIFLMPFVLGPPPFVALPLILALYVLKVGVAFPVDWYPDRNTGD